LENSLVTRTRHITVRSEKALATAAAALAQQSEIMAAIHARVGTPPLRDFAADFSGIAKIVVGQQLSAQSAAAIWTRVSSAIDPFDANSILSRSDSALTSLGLSRGKCKTLKALATAVADGKLDIARLQHAPEETIVETLTAVHGIGPWTADIYLLFALRRADAFAPGDLALQLAVQRNFKLKERPSAQDVLRIAERWRPWRAVAARLLWSDYALMRATLPRHTQKQFAVPKAKPLKK
jgi:DNA-3-methyladenine glycosylase II